MSKLKQKFNGATGELNLVNEYNGEDFVPREGTFGNREEFLAPTSLDRIAGNQYTEVTAPNHGLLVGDTIEIEGTNLTENATSIKSLQFNLNDANIAYVYIATAGSVEVLDYWSVGDTFEIIDGTTYPLLNGSWEIVGTSNIGFTVLHLDITGSGQGVVGGGYVSDSDARVQYYGETARNADFYNNRFQVNQIIDENTFRFRTESNDNFPHIYQLRDGNVFNIPFTKMYKYSRANQALFGGASIDGAGVVTTTISQEGEVPIEAGDFINISYRPLDKYADKKRRWSSTKSNKVLTRVGNTITIQTEAVDRGGAWASFSGVYSTKVYPAISINGNIHFETHPDELPIWNDYSLIDRHILEDHSLDTNNPHNVTKAQVELDQVDNKKQIPIIGTVQAGVNVYPFTLTNIFTPRLVDFEVIGGHTFEVGDVVTVTGTADWDTTYTVTELNVGGNPDVFRAEAAPGFIPGAGYSYFSWFYYTNTTGSFTETITAEPVTGNVFFGAEPTTYAGWDRLAVANKGYVDDQVGANNELSEVLTNGNTTGANIIDHNIADGQTRAIGTSGIQELVGTSAEGFMLLSTDGLGTKTRSWFNLSNQVFGGGVVQFGIGNTTGTLPDAGASITNQGGVYLYANAQQKVQIGHTATFFSNNIVRYTSSPTLTLDEEFAHKGYVDSVVVGALVYQGAYDASTVAPSGTALKGHTYTVTVAGTGGGYFSLALEVGDVIIAEVDNPASEADWTVVNKNIDQATETVAGIAEIATQAETDAGVDDTRFVTPAKLEGRLTNLNGSFATTLLAGDFATNGDGTATATANHNFGTDDVLVECYDFSTKETVLVDKIDRTDTNNVAITIAEPVSAIRVVITQTAPVYQGVSGRNVATNLASGSTLNNNDIIITDANAVSGGGDVTYNLPPVGTSNNFRIDVKKTDSSVDKIILDPNGAETIEGASTLEITTQWEAVSIVCNGASWFVIASF